MSWKKAMLEAWETLRKREQEKRKKAEEKKKQSRG
jgi:hypothetical protein